MLPQGNEITGVGRVESCQYSDQERTGEIPYGEYTVKANMLAGKNVL